MYIWVPLHGWPDRNSSDRWGVWTLKSWTSIIIYFQFFSLVPCLIWTNSNFNRTFKLDWHSNRIPSLYYMENAQSWNWLQVFFLASAKIFLIKKFGLVYFLFRILATKSWKDFNGRFSFSSLIIMCMYGSVTMYVCLSKVHVYSKCG